MNLIEAVQAEMTRCRELLKEYYKIGLAGQFGARVIQDSLTAAQAALEQENVVALVNALHDLKARK